MTPFCVEGCFCDPGFLVDVKGDCVEPAGCDIGELLPILHHILFLYIMSSSLLQLIASMSIQLT